MDNLISKDKLILYLNDWRFGVAPDETTPAKYQDMRLVMASTIYDCMKAVENFPTVAIPSATGHWEKTPKAVMGEGYMWYCDKCGHEVYQDSSRDYPSENFCPHCGADMRGDTDADSD